MTARRRRLEALEAAHAGRVDSAEARMRAAYLDELSDRELDELHAALLRAEGHADPDSEAARVRAEVEAMSDEELWALIARMDGGTP
ncbi:hypothetical protein HNQ07_000427 [Deinococcus metalli]|uniref:Uncharacterized protein n=1 Tax=Deinococcus metalli TaxID=1141878 RepID=A0A7W8KC24_9DEIO|nr:hypothetical protein [Deinococcus metalli]MBB5374983.1 hypothetical protein [Deinococcus metalli]GHF32301.1 hypothetical protein GCM10017781_06160 [Deinococcus metalli]